MKEGGLTAASFLPGPHGPSLHPPPHVTYPPGLSVTHPPGSANPGTSEGMNREDR